MLKYVSLLLIVFFLTACTTSEHVAINSDDRWSKSYTDQKRLDTIAEIAKQGEAGAMAAAILMQKEQEAVLDKPKKGFFSRVFSNE